MIHLASYKEQYILHHKHDFLLGFASSPRSFAFPLSPYLGVVFLSVSVSVQLRVRPIKGAPNAITILLYYLPSISLQVYVPLISACINSGRRSRQETHLLRRRLGAPHVSRRRTNGSRGDRSRRRRLVSSRRPAAKGRDRRKPPGTQRRSSRRPQGCYGNMCMTGREKLPLAVGEKRGGGGEEEGEALE